MNASLSRYGAALALVAFAAVVITGSLRDPNFWRTPDQRGDALLRTKKFAEAGKAYTDPWRIGMAQYRNGDFEAAAKTFARVPGATGAFDQGNASLMHGNYTAAIASYNRALGFHTHWREAEENKALALARQAKMEASGEDREKEQTSQVKPDEIVFDQKGENKKAPTTQINGAQMSDEELRATWLRRVQTTPADFLRAKFSYQAAHSAPDESAKEK